VVLEDDRDVHGAPQLSIFFRDHSKGAEAPRNITMRRIVEL
jgi:hypothetical protein